MVKRLHLIIIFILLIFSYVSKAQDPQFTQFYANRLYLNPAFAGIDRCPRLTLNYRNQWPALGSTYITYSASYDQYVRPIEGGLGLHIMQDVEGDGAISTFYLSGMYSYTVAVNRKFSVTGGFQASFMQKKLNMDFIFPDMIHPLYGPIYPTKETLVPTDLNDITFDFSAGFLGASENYFFGLAVHHLTEPQESWREARDADLPRKYTLHFGINLPLHNQFRGYRKGELFLSPNVLFHQQRDFQQFNFGLYLYRKNLVAGIWLRQNFKFNYDSFIMMLGFKQKKISIGYSYDLTVSKLSNQTLGAHEISFSYLFNCPKRTVKFRPIDCPSF